MLKIYKHNDAKVKSNIENLKLDAVSISDSNLVDDIIFSMSEYGVIDCLEKGFPDKRRHNIVIPFNLILTLAIAAKMKVHTSLTDIPYAITSHRTLASLGFNASLNDDPYWFTEGTLRNLLAKYTSKDLIDCYNNTVQNYILKHLDICANIHILDCTKIAVNQDNQNYENASWAIDRKGERMFGYKLASLRGLYKDSGVIEEICFDTASVNDIKLCKNLLMNSKVLREGDCVLMDRGFIDRETIKYLKETRGVDVYIPMKKNMSEYLQAISIADTSDDWVPHPSRTDQMICYAGIVDNSWSYPLTEEIFTLNAVVVWDINTQHKAVFTTTDMDKSGEEIISMYELRTEIEEDFRQLKDFWKLESFKSTKLNVISFHLICTLFGYLFYQLYINSKDGEDFLGKSLPVALKNYKTSFNPYLVLYSDESFMIMSIKEFIDYLSELSDVVRKFVLNFVK